MKQIISCLLVVLALNCSAQYYLKFKNEDNVPIVVTLKNEKKVFNVFAKDTTITFNVNPIHLNLGYVIQSERGIFNSEDSGPLVPAGNYIVVLMWNSKNNLYRTVLRKKNDDD